MKNFRSMISVLLTVCILISLVPMTVLAVDVPEVVTETVAVTSEVTVEPTPKTTSIPTPDTISTPEVTVSPVTEMTVTPTTEVPANRMPEAIVAPLSDQNILGNGTCGDNLTWTLSNDGVLTISGNGAMINYNQLAEPVPPWNDFISQIKTIVISNGITSIGRLSFADCSNLTNVTIPSSVSRIGSSAFSKCSALESIIIPDSVASIGQGAFSGCSALTNVIIPEKVTSISASVFERCSALKSVTLPQSVTTIDAMAFHLCYALTNVTIPEGVVSIGNFAFSGCKSLTNFIITDGVISIGNYAFNDCYSLTSVTIPESVISIGQGAFSQCTALTSVVIPEGVTNIDEDVFFGCESLTSVTIPQSVTSIGKSAFQSCSSLTGVIIPENVTNIDDSAFAFCSLLTNVMIPPSALSVGDKAFYYCKSLRNVTIPEGVTSIGDYSFSGCNELVSVTIPKSVISIGSYAFYSCTLLTSATILEGVTSIGNSAFENCIKMKNVNTPNSLTSIGERAFYNCRSLKSITISKNLKIIGKSAFDYCTPLSDVYYAGGEYEWNNISIGDKNDGLLSANIHYYAFGSDEEQEDIVDNEIGDINDVELERFSVICYANTYDSKDSREVFQLCSGVTVTAGDVSVVTNQNGQATLRTEKQDVTFSKEGYVPRTISFDKLADNEYKIYLQKESDYPVINALWLGDVDILHKDFVLDIGSELTHTLTVEAESKSSISSIKLWQEGNFVELKDSANSVCITKNFDITEDIYLIISNELGYTAKKTLCIKTRDAMELEGFTFNLGESISFALPESAGALAGHEMEIELPFDVPVELSAENGKIFVSFGYAPDEVDNDHMNEAEVDRQKRYVEEVKDFLACSLKADSPEEWYRLYNGTRHRLGDYMATMEGSLGIEGSYHILGYAEGYMDGENFVLTGSGGIIVFEGSISKSWPFMASGVPMFWEMEFSGDLEGQINLYINNKIKEFTPRMEIEGNIGLSGGLGIGLAEVIAASGGLHGELQNLLNINRGSIDYYRLDALLEWYYKFILGGFSYSDSFSIAEATWYEYPDPGSSVMLLSMDNEEETSAAEAPFTYYDISKYVMDDLSYLAVGSGFNGGGSSTSVWSLRSGGPFVSNAYEGADPQTANFSDGSRLAVWIGYNSEHSGLNALNLYYSYYNGVWSEPQVVENDGTYDGAPCLKVIADTAYLVWQDASGNISDSATLAETAELREISGAVFDRDTLSFACGSISGNSGVLNMTPTLCGNGNTVYAVWLSNSQNDYFGQNNANSILCSRLSNGKWGTPSVCYSGLGPVINFDAAYSDGLSIAYSMDDDCDLSTNNDVEVYLNGVAQTENECLDSGVCFSDGKLYWYSGGELVMNGENTMAEGVTISSDRYQIVNENGVKALVYATGDGLASKLYAAYYDSSSGQWGNPVLLYNDNSNIPAFSATATPDGQLSALIQRQAIVGDFGDRNPYGEVCLVWYNAPLGCNVTVDDVWFDDSTYVSGKYMKFYLTVSNIGELAVPNLKLELLDDEGNVLQTKTVSEILLSGEMREIEFSFLIDEISQNRVLTLKATTVDMEETDLNNNSIDLTLYWNDLAVENVCYGIGADNNTIIHANIVNRGYDVQNDVVAELRENAVDGTVVETKVIDEIDAFSLNNVSFTVSENICDVYYVCVVPKDSNRNFGNNSDFVRIVGATNPDDVTPTPPPAVAPEPTPSPITNPFTDVADDAWYASPVLWAYANNVTGGKTKTTFAPDEGCTRAQVVTFLWAANGRLEPTSMDNPFSDVADDAWYLKPVLWAVENGITSGVTEDKFGPEQTCTRAQIVTFLYAAVGKPEVTGNSTFVDIVDTDWFTKPVLWAAENEVTGGIGGGKFGPNNVCTRAQVVTFLFKVYG